MRENIYRTTIQVTGATGGAGSATANATSSVIVDGVVVGIYLEYTDTPPATADLVIEEANNSPAMDILTETNYNTDGWVFPVHDVVSSDGTAITNGYQEVYVSDYVKATISQVNDNDGVNVTIVWRSLR